MKKILALTLAVALLLFTGCAKSNTQGETQKDSTNTYGGFKVVSLKGPTSMGIVKMMEDNKNNSYEMLGTADEAVGKITKGEADIALVPANLASVLYNKTEGKVKIAGINTLGVLYVVEKGETVKSINDLKGKTVISTGKGTTPEYAFNYILSQNGINPSSDLTIEYKSEATEAAGEIMADRASIAVLPQPYVTTVLQKNPELRIALNLTEEWEKASKDSALVTGVVLVRKEIAENRKTDLDSFLNEYKQSVNYVNTNVEEAAKLVETYGIVNKEVAEKAIPLCNIVLIEGNEMKTKLNGYFNALYEQNQASVGGKLPDEAIYYGN